MFKSFLWRLALVVFAASISSQDFAFAVLVVPSTTSVTVGETLLFRTVVPATLPGSEVLDLKPDAVFLSNGPGDPATVTYAVESVAALLGKVPIFGICLGHQIAARALGARTFKLKFGHRGANHPVKDLRTGRVAVTSQNHGYAVDTDSLPSRVEVTHLNLNDHTCEGFVDADAKLLAVQYHPESSPGPHDSFNLFRDFLTMTVGRP